MRLQRYEYYLLGLYDSHLFIKVIVESTTGFQANAETSFSYTNVVTTGAITSNTQTIPVFVPKGRKYVFFASWLASQ